MDDITLDAVIAMLSDINDEVDFSTEDKLVDNRILDSFDILQKTLIVRKTFTK